MACDELIPKLITQLNKIPFYTEKIPKSLSREWVEKYINPLIKQDYNIEDVMNTLCEHIAYQIGLHLKNESVLITGGGTFNTYLIERIKNYSKSRIIIPNKDIINLKEAVIFAFLGVLRLRNEVNCLKSVTGAKRNCSGGVIHKI